MPAKVRVPRAGVTVPVAGAGTEVAIVTGVRSVVLFDTYSLFFRAHHALVPLSTTRGEPTAAIYGFCGLLLKVLREHAPGALAFALDAPQKTFRHERYPQYKATRAPTPVVLAAQFARLDELLKMLAVPRFAVAGFEADDVLATLARHLRASERPALIVSGDRDLFQVANGSVRVLFVGARGKDAIIYDRDKIVERFGIEPRQLPTWTALVGDSSDNVHGVPGIGSGTATRLVQRFGSVSGLLERIHQVAPERIRSRILERREQLLTNEELLRLRDDVPLETDVWVGPLRAEALQRLRDFFRELEFKSLEARLNAVEAALHIAGDPPV